MTAAVRSRHGLKALKARVTVRGMASVDMRSAAAQALFAWRGELLNALGGPEHVSPQKAALIETCVRTRLYIDHVDAFLLAQNSLVNRKRKSVLPILRERTQLCDSLTRTLTTLGLDRVEIIPTLEQHFASRNVEDDEPSPPEPQESQEPGIGSDEANDSDDRPANLQIDSPVEESER